MENFKEKYGEWLLPALGFVTGMLTGLVLGFVLTGLKGGKIMLFSNNTIGSGNSATDTPIGSGNGCGNSAADTLIGGQKNGTEK